MSLKENYREFRAGKYLSDVVPIQNGLKHGALLPPLFLNFALEYTIMDNFVSDHHTEEQFSNQRLQILMKFVEV
jgi:hypothetical protein